MAVAYLESAPWGLIQILPGQLNDPEVQFSLLQKEYTEVDGLKRAI